VSGGTGAAPVWGAATTTLIAPGTSVGTGQTYTITNATITSKFKVLELYLNDVGSNNASTLSIQISGDGVTYTTLFAIGSTAASNDEIFGVVKIVAADLLTGTRLISANTNKLTSGPASIFSQTVSVATGYISFIRLDWSSTDVFDAGTVALVGYA
jgi:hypothetical protein